MIGYGENVQNAISVYNILMENQISNLKNLGLQSAYAQGCTI